MHAKSQCGRADMADLIQACEQYAKEKFGNSTVAK
jgi:hypothetical protein